MARKARPRNPRVMAMDVIKVMAGNVAAMKARWSWVPSTRYRWEGDFVVVHDPRERKDIPASEYRENDPKEWEHLAAYMDVIADQAAQLAAFARLQEQAARDRLA